MLFHDKSIALDGTYSACGIVCRGGDGDGLTTICGKIHLQSVGRITYAPDLCAIDRIDRIGKIIGEGLEIGAERDGVTGNAHVVAQLEAVRDIRDLLVCM